MTRAQLREEYEGLVAEAQAITAAVAANEYRIPAYEADVNALRTAMATWIEAAELEWGARAVPAISALRTLGVALLDLRSQVQPGDEDIEQVIDREISLLELAHQWYGDASRWTELAARNTGLRHPGFVPPGTTLVRHAR